MTGTQGDEWQAGRGTAPEGMGPCLAVSLAGLGELVSRRPLHIHMKLFFADSLPRPAKVATATLDWPEVRFALAPHLDAHPWERSIAFFHDPCPCPQIQSQDPGCSEIMTERIRLTGQYLTGYPIHVCVYSVRPFSGGLWFPLRFAT